mmetsp:Transcript_63896/g.161929  ORF Transcript_63896/g.161929 Transcript_63896/m.161929 type:complete len:211 (-) Transcript_63896:214-846(-)
MSVFKVSMASPLVCISSDRAFLSTAQAVLEAVKAVSVSPFFPVNSVFNFSKSSMMPEDLNLYAGSLGSTPCCKKACADFELPSEKPRASASSILSEASFKTSLWDCRKAAGLAPVNAMMAFAMELMAFVRSASSASNSAASFWQRVTVSSSSLANSSCFFFRAESSVILPSLVAVSSAMLAESESILSWPSVMAVDLDAVLSLQKQANLS